jgi:hypothetical protein
MYIVLLPPGDNPIAVNKYIKIIIGIFGIRAEGKKSGKASCWIIPLTSVIETKNVWF